MPDQLDATVAMRIGTAFAELDAGDAAAAHGGEIEVGELAAPDRLLLVLRVEDDERGKSVFVDRAVEQLVQIVERQVGEPLRDLPRRGHAHADEDIPFAVLPGTGLEEALQRNGVGRVGGFGERSLHVGGRHLAPSDRPASKAAALGGSAPGRPDSRTWIVPTPVPGPFPRPSIRRTVCAATACALSNILTPTGSAAAMSSWTSG